MKIQTKITITYVLLAVLIIAGIGTFFSRQMESDFKERLVDDLSRQADLILYVLQKDSPSSFAKIDGEVKLISGLEHLRITLIDAQGNVLADSDVPREEISKVQNHLDRPEVQEASQYGVGHATRHSATVDRDFLYMAKEVNRSSRSGLFQSVQYIRLSVPYEEVQRQLDIMRSIEIVTGFGVLIGMIIVSIIISRRIINPMTQIARDVERIRAGDLDARLSVKSNDETRSKSDQ
jgi:two-component system phosphate regulon sensor histidine kinase PhoR